MEIIERAPEIIEALGSMRSEKIRYGTIAGQPRQPEANKIAKAIELIRALQAELFDQKAVMDVYGGEDGIVAVYEELERVKKERDAAIADIERAEYESEEVNRFLNNTIYPACDYSIYEELFDLTSEVINWQYDEVWRGKKREDADETE